MPDIPDIKRTEWECPGCGTLYAVPDTSGLTLCPTCSAANGEKSLPPSRGIKKIGGTITTSLIWLSAGASFVLWCFALICYQEKPVFSMLVIVANVPLACGFVILSVRILLSKSMNAFQKAVSVVSAIHGAIGLLIIPPVFVVSLYKKENRWSDRIVYEGDFAVALIQSMTVAVSIGGAYAVCLGIVTMIKFITRPTQS